MAERLPRKQAAMRDVAGEAGVSLATVSYVLNKSYQIRKIRPETQGCVLAAVQRLNYRVHPIGRALQQGHTRQVILLIVGRDLTMSHSAAKEMGLKCPQDILIVGFGDAEEGRYFHPQLTTIGLSEQKVADSAIGLLRQMQLGQNRQTQHLLVREDLIVREFTGSMVVRPGPPARLAASARDLPANA